MSSIEFVPPPVLGEIDPRVAHNIIVDPDLKLGMRTARNVLMTNKLEIATRPHTVDRAKTPEISLHPDSRSFAFRLPDGSFTTITFGYLEINQTVEGSEDTFTTITTTWGDTAIVEMDVCQHENDLMCVSGTTEPYIFRYDPTGGTYTWIKVTTAATGTDDPAWVTDSDWPESVSFMIGRFIFVSPRHFYGSVAGTVTDYDIAEITVDGDTVVKASSAFSYDAADDTDSGFHWVRGGSMAFGGSPSGTWSLANYEDGLNAQKPFIKNYSSVGTYNVPAVDTHKGMVYFLPDGVTCKMFAITPNGPINDELNKYSKHIFKEYKPVRMVFQRTPDTVVWILREDGTLVAFVTDDQRMAWLPIDTNGFIHDIWMAKDSLTEYLYMDVTRGSDRRIERIENLDSLESEYLLDALITVEEDPALTPTTVTAGASSEAILNLVAHGLSDNQAITITGVSEQPYGYVDLIGVDSFSITLPNQNLLLYADVTTITVREAVEDLTYAYLANETLDVYTDGYYTSLTADGAGKITFETPASEVALGYSYVSYIEPRSFADKTFHYKAVVDMIHPRVYSTKALMQGRTYDLMLDNETQIIDGEGNPFTGSVRDLRVGGGMDDDCTFLVGGRRTPFVISSILVMITVGEN